MNKIYRIIWNTNLKVWQAVGEIGKGAGKSTSDRRKKRHTSALAGAAVCLLSTQVYSASLPTNGVVSSGSGNIVQSGNTLNITQNSNKMAIDWQSFSVGKDNTVNFIQPSSSSIALNRVVGNDVSNIQGAINANGQVFLINPNGVLFSTTAQVNVGGLVASTRNITNDQFNAGNFKFEGSNSNAIINQGNIKTADGGYVVMIAAKIENTGNITANNGTVGLAAGNLVTVDMGGPVKLKVEQGAINALINNGGAIQSQNGYILLTAKAAGDLAASVINNTGNIEASSLSKKDGKVALLGDDMMDDLAIALSADHITVSGEITANHRDVQIGHPTNALTEITSTAHLTGDFIETSGKQLVIENGVRVQAKTWLLDPTDISVASGGTESLSGTPATTTTAGSVTVSGATINAQLDNGTSVMLEASHDITVSDHISKTSGSDATLTLKAGRDIVLNNNISVTSTSNKLNMVLWSDTDGNNDGGVLFKPNSSVVTNGGHLWVGGGSGSSTWNGLTVGNSYTGKLNQNDGSSLSVIAPGVNVSSAVLNTGSGDIYLYGKSGQTTYQYGIGVRVVSTTQLIGNNITLKGIGSASTGTYQSNWGVDVEHTTQVTATGDIVLEGTGGGSNANGNNNYGVNLAGSAIVQTSGNGNITITGTGGGQSGQVNSTNNDGVSVANTAQIITANGFISLTGIKGQNANSEGVSLGATDTSKPINSTGGGNISVIADSLTIGASQRLSSSGNLEIKPYTTGTTIGIGGASGTLSLASSYFSSNFVDGFSSITIGNATSGNITIGGTTSYNDPLTLKTANDITTNTNTTLTGTSGQTASLVLWADADASGSGSIYLKDTTAITTNGGHLWLGGGSQSATAWNGLTVGDGYAMAGTTHTTVLGTFKNGITLDKSTLSTDAGSIYMAGKSLNQSGASVGYIGIYQEGTSINTTTGTININAVSAQNTNRNYYWNYGLLMSANANGTNASITSTSGTITVQGETSFVGAFYGSGIGLYSFNNANSVVKIQTTSGNISLTGSLNSTGYNDQYGGIYLYGSGKEMIVSQTGDISLIANSANANVSGLNVAPGNTTSYIGYDGTNSYTGNITLSSNTSVSFEGAIVAHTLDLQGSGVSYSLTNTGNQIDSLTATTGSVHYVNAGALSVGAITTTGTISLATQTGDMTLTGAISTTDTSSSAITLNAGKSASAGTATGGNIIVSGGTISVGTGGRATLYTGDLSASTGLNSIASTGRYFNSDETSTLTNISNGYYAVYRDLQSIYLRLITGSSIYGDTPTFTYGLYDAASGGAVVNDASATGSANWTGAPTSTSNIGTYTLTYTNGISAGNTNYRIVAGNAENWTITARPTTPPPTLTAYVRLVGGSSYYGDRITLNYALYDSPTGGNLISKSSAESHGSASWSGAPTATSGVGSYTVDYQGGIGSWNSRYTIASGGSAIWTILPKPVTLSVAKVYDGSAVFDSGFALSGLANGDSVTLTGSANVASKNAGSYNSFSQNTLALSNANYTLTGANINATISPKALSVTGTSAIDKAYDGTTKADIIVGTLSGFVGNESVSASADGTFDSASSGNRTATAVYKLADGTNGGLASNYTLANTSGLTAKITGDTVIPTVAPTVAPTPSPTDVPTSAPTSAPLSPTEQHIIERSIIYTQKTLNTPTQHTSQLITYPVTLIEPTQPELPVTTNTTEINTVTSIPTTINTAVNPSSHTVNQKQTDTPPKNTLLEPDHQNQNTQTNKITTVHDNTVSGYQASRQPTTNTLNHSHAINDSNTQNDTTTLNTLNTIDNDRTEHNTSSVYHKVQTKLNRSESEDGVTTLASRNNSDNTTNSQAHTDSPQVITAQKTSRYHKINTKNSTQYAQRNHKKQENGLSEGSNNKKVNLILSKNTREQQISLDQQRLNRMISLLEINNPYLNKQIRAQIKKHQLNHINDLTTDQHNKTTDELPTEINNMNHTELAIFIKNLIKGITLNEANISVNNISVNNKVTHDVNTATTQLENDANQSDQAKMTTQIMSKLNKPEHRADINNMDVLIEQLTTTSNDNSKDDTKNNHEENHHNQDKKLIQLIKNIVKQNMNAETSNLNQ